MGKRFVYWVRQLMAADPPAADLQHKFAYRS